MQITQDVRYRKGEFVKNLRVAAGALTTAVLLMPAAAVAAPAPLPTVEGVPVLARAWISNTQDGGSAVLTVHGVRRIEGATVVYFSMGLPKGAPADANRFFSYYGGGFWNTLTVGNSASGAECAVSLLDIAGGKAYSTLPISDANSCLGTKGIDFSPPADKPNAAVVGWSIVAPLPKDVTTVDVFISSQVLQDVPVEDGLLEPVSQDSVPVVGTGWPKIPTARLSEVVDADKAVFPLMSRVQPIDVAVAEAQTSEGVQLEIPASVLFEFDKSDLTPAAGEAIDAAVAKMTAAGTSGAITVTGYTDSTGDDAYNQALSERRAQSVLAALQAKLPGTITLTAEGKGEADPIADNGTDDGRALNRRVTITLPK